MSASLPVRWMSAIRNVVVKFLHGLLVGFAPMVLIVVAVVYLAINPLLVIFVGFIVAPLRVFVHEMGHAIASWLVGGKVVDIVVGKGAILWRWTFGSTHLTVRKPPWGGQCETYIVPTSAYRARNIFMILSGVGAECVAASILFALPFNEWLGIESSRSWLDVWPSRYPQGSDDFLRYQVLLVWFAGWSVLLSLTPWSYLGGKFAGKNDGDLIVDYLRLSPLKLLIRQADLFVAYGDLRRGVGLYTAILRRPDLEPAKRVEMLDAAACQPLFADLPDGVPLALQQIEEAIRLAPDQVTLRGTRGSLLAELGRMDEARPILLEVLTTSASENDRQICLSYLAWIAAREGAEAGCREYLAQVTARTGIPPRLVAKTHIALRALRQKSRPYQIVREYA